jgi:hypothetical protein
MDPRKKTSNEGIGNIPRTWKHDGSIVYDITKAGGAAAVGRALAQKSADTVGLAVDGEPVIGGLELVESDGFCNVKTGGQALPGGVGATLTPGKKFVGALGGVGGVEAGFIRNAAAGAESENATECRIEDATVTTAVRVFIAK